MPNRPGNCEEDANKTQQTNRLKKSIGSRRLALDPLALLYEASH